MTSSEEKAYCDLLTPVVCGNCLGQNNVINYCLQCHANICDECKSTHCDANLTKDHIILHRTHPQVVKARRSKKIYCSNHTGKEYVTYCASCGVPCCATCIEVDHKGDDFTDLEKAVRETESKVDQLVRKLERDLIPLYKNALSKLKEEPNSYQRSVNDVKLSAKKKIQQLRYQLDKAEDTIMSDLDKRAENDMKKIEEKKAYLKENLKKLKSTVEKGKKAPVDASLFFTKNEVAKINVMEPIQMPGPGNLSFHSSTFHFPSAFDAIGRITNDTEKCLHDASNQVQHDSIQEDRFEYSTKL